MLFSQGFFLHAGFFISKTMKNPAPHYFSLLWFPFHNNKNMVMFFGFVIPNK